MFKKTADLGDNGTPKVEGKMGDYEAPAGWEEVEMNEANVTELQTRSHKCQTLSY